MLYGGFIDCFVEVVALRGGLLLIVELAVQDVFDRDLSVFVGRRSRNLCAVLVPEAIHRALKRCHAVMIDLEELDAAPGDPVFDVHRHDRMLRERHSLRFGLFVLILDVDLRHGVADGLLACDVGIHGKILCDGSAVSAGRDDQRPVVDVAGDLKVPALDDPIFGRFQNLEAAELEGIGDRNAVGRMRRLVLCDRHLLIRRELAACAARHLMQHIRAEGQVLRDRVAGGVRGNAVAFRGFRVIVAARRLEVDLKDCTLLGHVVAVYHVGVLRDADLIQLHLLLHGDGDLIVLEGEFAGRRADRVACAVELIAGRGRNFLDVPAIAANVFLGCKLPVRVGRVLIDQVISSIHTVDRARKRGVALRSTGRAVVLRDRGRPFFEDV